MQADGPRPPLPGPAQAAASFHELDHQAADTVIGRDVRGDPHHVPRPIDAPHPLPARGAKGQCAPRRPGRWLRHRRGKTFLTSSSTFGKPTARRPRRHGGLGLGLAIVRYLVEAHDGTIEAQSAGLGQGATFTMTLPSPPFTPPPPPPLHPSPRPGGARDTEGDEDRFAPTTTATVSICSFLRLSAFGAEVRSATSVKEARWSSWNVSRLP